jgi:hypothetical protein
MPSLSRSPSPVSDRRQQVSRRYCSGRSPQARRSPPSPKGPACDLLPPRARNGQSSSAFTAEVYGSTPCGLVAILFPSLRERQDSPAPRRGVLMLASSAGHATAIPHSARISGCVIPRTNRPHLPHSTRQIIRDVIVPRLRRRSTNDDSRPLMTAVGETAHVDEFRRDSPGGITFSN